MKYNGLDVFDIILREDDIGVKATSLVTIPAIESQFLYFNKDKPQFLFANDEKSEIIGAFMIPDKLIYREINGHKFYVNFTKEVIKDLTSRMIKTGTAGLFTVQHQMDVEDGGVEIQEIWIKETENDKSVDFGIDEPIGTAFMKVKVNDEAIRNHVKEFGLNGFSIELDASIVEKNELLFKEEEPKIEKMSIKDVFSNEIEVNDVQLHFNAELGKGTYLVVEGEEGKPEPYTGDFTHENVEYKVENGVVLETVDIQLSQAEAMQGLLDKFSEVKESVDAILEMKEAIENKEAELEQLKAQFEAEKQEFAEKKSKGVTEVRSDLREPEAVVHNAQNFNTWMSKF